MGTNKNALIRYKVLDSCFRNPGKRYFIADLIDACEQALHDVSISRRQLFDDISFMESKAGWQIDLEKFRDGKKVYYRYADPAFSINNMPLNEVEISQLQNAVDILSQFKGMPQFEWVNELVPKLRQGLTTGHEETTVIEFDGNKYLKGIEHLGSLYNAIIYKKVLSVSYQPFGDENPSVITMHPYFLKQYNNRWFLLGYNPQNERYDWNLALDRIIIFTETGGRYKANNRINWNEYFEDIIGVTKPVDRSVENIRLHFIPKTGRYIESKPLHGSQKSRWLDNKMLEVDLELMINYELERLLLSYADSVKVIAPLKLRQIMAQKLQQALELNE